MAAVKAGLVYVPLDPSYPMRRLQQIADDADIGWVLTTNNYHIRHHSTVLEESNTNYGCSAILWDRVFGTFSEGPVVDAGIGPTEPSTWRKLLMPFREPEDSAVAPESVRT